jgi:hypothetical protein
MFGRLSEREAGRFVLGEPDCRDHDRPPSFKASREPVSHRQEAIGLAPLRGNSRPADPHRPPRFNSFG